MKKTKSKAALSSIILLVIGIMLFSIGIAIEINFFNVNHFIRKESILELRNNYLATSLFAFFLSWIYHNIDKSMR